MTMPLMETDVAVVGGGPAGLAAAAVLAEHGVRPLLVDEQPRLGGQIYRQPPESFKVSRVSKPQQAGKRLVASVVAADGVDTLLGATVIGGFPNAAESAPPTVQAPLEWTVAAAVAPDPRVQVAVVQDGRLLRVLAKKLLVATGAYDLPIPVPGWTLPGAMSAGGLQTFMKSQRLLPGGPVVVAGSHPFVLIVADQLAAAGAEISRVAFAGAPWSRTSLGHGALAGLSSPRKAAQFVTALDRLRRAGVSIDWSTTVTSIHGEDRVREVQLAGLDRHGYLRPQTSRSVRCDYVGLSFGFAASTELARQLGCRSTWDFPAGGWIIDHDDWMRTSQPVVSVAGEVAGVAGADVAQLQGKIAALGLLVDLGVLTPQTAATEARPTRVKLAAAQRFARHVRDAFTPPLDALMQLADADTVLCRCESLTKGELVADLDARTFLGTASATKLVTRAGMGPCQGRMCGLAVAHLTATKRDTTVEEVGAFTPRPPLKPVPAAVLAKAWQEATDTDVQW